MSMIRKLVTGLFFIYTLMAGLFVAGYAMEDPGGWKGFAMCASWMLPTAVVAWLLFRSKSIPAWVTLLLSLSVILVNISTAIWPSSIGMWLDQVGPVTAVFTLAVVTVFALLAFRDPMLAGSHLVAISLVSLAAVFAARTSHGFPGGSATEFVALPALIVGGFLVATSTRRTGAGDIS